MPSARSWPQDGPAAPPAATAVLPGWLPARLSPLQHRLGCQAGTATASTAARPSAVSQLLLMAHPTCEWRREAVGEGGRKGWGLCFVTLMKHRFLLGLFGASFAGDIRTSLCSHIHPTLLSWRSFHSSQPRGCLPKRQSPLQHQAPSCVEHNSCNGTELWLGALPNAAVRIRPSPRPRMNVPRSLLCTDTMGCCVALWSVWLAVPTLELHRAMYLGVTRRTQCNTFQIATDTN